MQAAFGAQLKSLYGQQFVLSVAIPGDACTPLSNAANINATVVIIQRGNCFMSTKVRLVDQGRSGGFQFCSKESLHSSKHIQLSIAEEQIQFSAIIHVVQGSRK